jgi:hypothetical protein
MFRRCFISQCLWVHISLLVRGRSNGVGGSTASSAVVCAQMYLEAGAYAIAKLCAKFEGNRYRNVGNFFRLHRFLARYRWLDARNVREGFVKIWKQSV